MQCEYLVRLWIYLTRSRSGWCSKSDGSWRRWHSGSRVRRQSFHEHTGIRSKGVERGTQLRFAGIFGSFLLGIALPAGLLGPVLFGGESLRAISTGALVTAVVSGVFGAWLLVVSCLASIKDLEKVLEPLQADMAVVLFLPYMFIVGTRSVWRRFVGS